MIFVVKYINVSLLLIVSIIGILFILFYLKKKNNHDKNKLITYSWISMIFIIFIGALLGKYIPIANLFAVGFVISIMDIISFMKLGKKTINAKVMNNKKLMSKLIVYGKSFKNGKPVPTKGLGDIVFYAILISGIYKLEYSNSCIIYGACLIFLGCVINWIIICFIYKKKGYKGFPATIIPFLCLLPLLIYLI